MQILLNLNAADRWNNPSFTLPNQGRKKLINSPRLQTTRTEKNNSPFADLLDPKTEERKRTKEAIRFVCKRA
jgi:hypothetical protein